MVDHHLAALQTLGRIESDLRDIAELEKRLDQTPLWQPAQVLRRQAAEARRLINGIQARMNRRLVVTLIGPSGAGKSTLLNALAGADNLSPVGIQRPTTQKPAIFSSDPASVDPLLAGLKNDAIQIITSPAAESLEHLILVDTPDTDSMAGREHQDIIVPIVERSDVLLCVFDAQNPKRRDHADFMAPLVRRFHGAAVIAVMNKCDRLEADELSEIVAPDFEAYLRTAWDTKPEVLLLISARNHLQQPGWDPQASPRHKMDQFDQLQDMIQSVFGRTGFHQDIRAANARRIRDFILTLAAEAAQQDRPSLTKAKEKMTAAGKTAFKQALAGLRQNNRHRMFGVNIRLYQALAQRWMGPVGWLVAVWSRLIVFGSGVASVLRFGNPVQQIWGAVSSWRRYKESRAALHALKDHSDVDLALQAFQKTLLVEWPDIAELMIKGRFDPRVRRPNPEEDLQANLGLDALWADRLDAEVESTAASMSHLLLQLLFNLPGTALIAYVGWITVRNFFLGRYVTSDFFLHALLTIVLVLLFSFFVFQVIVRLAVGRERIEGRALEQVKETVLSQPLSLSNNLVRQIEGVIALADDTGLILSKESIHGNNLYG